MPKLEVGMPVFLKPVNNMARYGNRKIQEHVIKKVGRKYFEVGNEDSDDRFNIRFHIEDRKQVTNYVPDWKIYFSNQEILEENEYEDLFRDVRSIFDRYGKVPLTLDQLRRIKAIISEGNSNN